MTIYAGDLNSLAADIHEWALEKGFWKGKDFDQHVVEKLLLIHSEVTEAAEVVRANKDSGSTKIPAYSHFDEELADIIIRTLDLAHAVGSNISGAVCAKMAYNETREHKHGKRF